jgi:hypothetical protein
LVDITPHDFHIRVQIEKADYTTDMDRKWRHSKWKKVRAEVKARTKRYVCSLEVCMAKIVV